MQHYNTLLSKATLEHPVYMELYIVSRTSEHSRKKLKANN